MKKETIAVIETKRYKLIRSDVGHLITISTDNPTKWLEDYCDYHGFDPKQFKLEPIN